MKPNIEHLDLDYFVGHSGATTFEELTDYIDDCYGFDVEIIYYSTAIKFLAENDPSLKWSLELASELGFSPADLNSELLASLVAREICREEYFEAEEDIKEFYNLD